MYHCINQVLVFAIRLIVWIELYGLVECLLGQCGLSKSQISFKEAFIDSRESCIKSDTCLAVLDSFSELLEVDIAHRTI